MRVLACAIGLCEILSVFISRDETRWDELFSFVLSARQDPTILSGISSDVKFHEFFWREIFHEIFREIFLKYFKNFTMFLGQYTHPFNIFSKPVKGKYLLLCMNSKILTSHTSHTNFHEIFKCFKE